MINASNQTLLNALIKNCFDMYFDAAQCAFNEIDDTDSLHDYGQTNKKEVIAQVKEHFADLCALHMEHGGGEDYVQEHAQACADKTNDAYNVRYVALQTQEHAQAQSEARTYADLYA